MVSAHPCRRRRRRRRRRHRHRAEHGQAAVELVALLPLIAALGAVLWQGAIVGQALWLAGTAARAAARADAVGADPPDAARRVVPDYLERGLVVRRGRDDDAVRVAIAVPSVLGNGRVTTVSARARLQDQTP